MVRQVHDGVAQGAGQFGPLNRRSQVAAAAANRVDREAVVSAQRSWRERGGEDSTRRCWMCLRPAACSWRRRMARVSDRFAFVPDVTTRADTMSDAPYFAAGPDRERLLHAGDSKSWDTSNRRPASRGPSEVDMLALTVTIPSYRQYSDRDGKFTVRVLLQPCVPRVLCGSRCALHAARRASIFMYITATKRGSSTADTRNLRNFTNR